LLLPSLIYAGNQCEEIKEQIACERVEDEERHGCRSCHDTITISASACPDRGYSCDVSWPLIITPKVLIADDRCSTAEAKCDGDAKLAVNRQIVTTKFRCNNSQWTVNGADRAEVVCAKRVPVCRQLTTDFTMCNFITSNQPQYDCVPPMTSTALQIECSPPHSNIILAPMDQSDGEKAIEVICDTSGKWMFKSDPSSTAVPLKDNFDTVSCTDAIV
ncbi:hypothetical protein PMAYCL1PPCAC_10803, partial [Pristionchus mayeri]